MALHGFSYFKLKRDSDLGPTLCSVYNKQNKKSRKQKTNKQKTPLPKYNKESLQNFRVFLIMTSTCFSLSFSTLLCSMTFFNLRKFDGTEFRTLIRLVFSQLKAKFSLSRQLSNCCSFSVLLSFPETSPIGLRVAIHCTALIR